MAEKPVTMNEFPAPIPPALVRRDGEAATLSATLRDYCALTKPEINALVLVTTVAGFCLASLSGAAPFDPGKLLGVAAATVLLASGNGALNQVLEYRFDSQMRRTMRRPVAAGRLGRTSASVFGAVLALGGVLWLFAGVNPQAGAVGLLGLLTYLFFYTPLKRTTPLCTLVGALAGAVPPLIGWLGGGGKFDSEAVVLYAILFLWQFPHFMSIGWIYRRDYARAGYRVIPAGRGRQRSVTLWTIVPCVALLALIVMPVLSRGETLLLPPACLLGAGLLFYGIRFAIRKTSSRARQLLTASILYVPLVMTLLIVIERYGPPTH